jgi:hypothetical protein
MMMISMGGGGDPNDREICVEVNNEDLKGLSIGDEVIITLRGLVEKLEAGSNVDDAGDGDELVPMGECPASIEIHIESHSVKKVGTNQFEKLVQEELDEDAEEPE